MRSLSTELKDEVTLETLHVCLQRCTLKCQLFAHTCVGRRLLTEVKTIESIPHHTSNEK